MILHGPRGIRVICHEIRKNLNMWPRQLISFTGALPSRPYLHCLCRLKKLGNFTMRVTDARILCLTTSLRSCLGYFRKRAVFSALFLYHRRMDRHYSFASFKYVEKRQSCQNKQTYCRSCYNNNEQPSLPSVHKTSSFRCFLSQSMFFVFKKEPTNRGLFFFYLPELTILSYGSIASKSASRTSLLPFASLMTWSIRLFTASHCSSVMDSGPTFFYRIDD